MRVLVTGSRDWTDRQAIEDELDKLYYDFPFRHLTVVHGAARGADTIAAMWAAARGSQVSAEAHPAEWERYGRAAGHRRNAEMVALGADICLAFPLGESRGTRGCIEMAKKAGIPVEVTEGLPSVRR